MSLIERLRAKRYVRERWVEPVGTMDEPCDADDEGAQEILRNPDGPEAAEAISSLLKRVGELEGALLSIRIMADADNPESYRADDREGCLDAVFAQASAALNSEAAAVGGR